MPNREEMKFEWWKLACEKNPDPIAFLDTNDRFVYCNQSWCKLLGYSESELIQKKWTEITKTEDVGGDTSEVNKIKNGTKEDYYLEKTYIRKDGKEVYINLYIHRYPESGNHQGYIAFAKKISSKDYEDLRNKFLDLQKSVLILQQNAVASEFISNQIALIEQKLEQNKELTKMALDGSKSSINIGDRVSDSISSGNKAGRDISIGSLPTWIVLLAVLLFILFFITACSTIVYLLLK